MIRPIWMAFDFDNGFEVRRAKLYIVGEYVLGAPTAYKIQFGFEGGQLYLSDFFFRIPDRPVFGNIQLGKFKAPFSPAMLTSSWDYPLMEYPAPVEAFAPGFKTGYQSDWYFEKARVLVAAGIFTDLGTNNIGDATDSLGRLNARVAWRPLVLGEGRDREFLHLGLGLGWVFAGDEEVRYRSRPESHLAPRLVDTGPIDAGDAAMLGFEAIWSRGPLSLMGEVILSQVQDRTLGDDLLFGGAYLSAHYILTGEVWPYDPKIGTFRSIKPARPFRFRNGGPGAWEVSLRASVLDLNDKSVRGGRMDILMAGLNWHWNKHSKWMLNGGVAEIENSDGQRSCPDRADALPTEVLGPEQEVSVNRIGIYIYAAGGGLYRLSESLDPGHCDLGSIIVVLFRLWNLSTRWSVPWQLEPRKKRSFRIAGFW